MATFWVITTVRNKDDRFLQFAFASPKHETIDELAGDLSDGEIVVGEKIDLPRRDMGGFQVATERRQPTAISANAIGLIQTYYKPTSRAE